MKKSNLLILSMLSMFFLLSACGSVEENDAQTIQSSEAAIQESVQQEQGEVTASETAENITENKEFIIQGVPLDRASERTVYSDITHLLKWLISVVCFAAMILLMISAANGKAIRIPFIGELEIFK